MPLHIPVLYDEVLAWLQPQPGQIIVDGTLGAGGHTRAIAERVGPTGLVIAIDRDPAAIAAASAADYASPVRFAQANYCDLGEVLEAVGVPIVDAMLLDLGLSSDQLADDRRGFSFHSSGPLDLRFDTTEGEPAWRLLARLHEDHLADLIYEFGEERFSRRIARKIVVRRATEPVRTATELADLVRSCYPSARHRGERIDPATRTFQALRIAVNEELKSLRVALGRTPEYVKPGGRFAVISFHSLEDRMVKEAFRGDDRYQELTRKPIVPSEEETTRNPRSRSAKLRVTTVGQVKRPENQPPKKP